MTTLDHTEGDSLTNLETVRARLARTSGLPFADVLTEAMILDVLNDYGVKYRDRIFNPVTTIWGFLSQVLSDDHSCRDAVSRIIAHRAASGIKVCSPNTASYCNARRRIQTGVLRTLARQTAQELQSSAAEGWKWIEVAPSFPYAHDHGLRRLEGEPPPEDDYQLRSEQSAPLGP